MDWIINLITYDDLDTHWPLPEELGFIKIMGKFLVEHTIEKLKERGFQSFRIIYKENYHKLDIKDVNIDYVHKDDKEVDGIFIRAIDIYVADLLDKGSLVDIYDEQGIKRAWIHGNNKRKKIVTVPPITYPWNLLDIMNILLRRINRFIHPTARIGENVVLRGSVYVEEGVKIYENSVIVGPTYIGKNTIIGSCSIVRESALSENVLIGSRMEVARSLFLERSETHSGYVGDSIFSYKVHSGAEFVTGNLRLDRENIYVKIGDEKIDTGRNKLGVIIGENTEIGVNVSTMPGILIGKNCLIGPGTVVFSNVPDKTKYYSRFEIVSKPI